MYRSETWTVSKKLKRIINATEMWTYRKVGHMSWKMERANVHVSEYLQAHCELKKIRIKITKYFGHITRHTSVPKTMLEGKVEGK